MISNKKKKIALIGIAGTPKDFLLSLHTLHCFVYQNKVIENNFEIILKQYPYIFPENIERESQEILEEIEKINPDILCFSCYVWNMDAVRFLSNKLKQKFENTKIILGGPEITKKGILSGKLNNLDSDFLIFGEAEKPFLALLKHQLDSKETKIENIKGLAYKKDNSYICNSEPDIIEDLTQIPSPYLEGYVEDEILTRPDIRVNIETQRGCNFRCAYCFYHKNFPKIRYRDSQMVINEIDYVFKKGVKIGRILDANFLSDKDFAKIILKGLIEKKIKMSLFFEILPQFLDEEIANLFGEYRRISPENRVTIGIGIQTINQEALEVIKRKIPVSFFEKAFNLLQKEKIIIKSDIILGLPLETKESYFKTLEFIVEKMRYGTNYLSLALLRILPGSDLIEIAKERNLVIDQRDNSHFVYSTTTMPRKDMLECLKLNATAFRLLCSIDMEKRMKLRDIYFDVKNALKISNVEMLKHFTEEFFNFLKNKNSDYTKPDFPNAENYYEKKIHNEIPNEWIIEKFKQLKNGQ